MLSYNVEFIIVIKKHNILNDVFGQNVWLAMAHIFQINKRTELWLDWDGKGGRAGYQFDID